MRMYGFVIIAACAAFLYGCAGTVPTELVNARSAYQQASEGPAAELAPADLHTAQQALARAEESFSKDSKSYRTRDLAYVAQRKAEMADAQGSIAREQNAQVRAADDYQVTQGHIIREKKQDLSDARIALAASEQSGDAMARKLSTEQQARRDADKRTVEALAALAKLATVTEDERGVVITLSGSVIFRSGDATLLSDAQSRLDTIADALLADPDRNVVVEGHTDSQGADEYNLTLSQRRADAVCDYLVRRGYPAARLHANGVGKGRPIASNDTSEGRANNRRVEIILERPAEQ